MHPTVILWVNEILKEFARRLPHHFHVTKKRQGEATISEEMTFEIFATFEATGSPLYSFSTGSIISIYESCMALCCEERFWPHIQRNGAWFHQHRAHPRHNFVEYTYFGESPFEENGVALFLPRLTMDKARHRIGDALYNMIVSLIAQHEQAHFLHGHLHQLGEAGIARYSESGSGSGRAQDGGAGTDYHAMEFDADLLPSRMYARGLSEVMFGRMSNEVGMGITPDRESYIRLASCAYFLLFCLLYKAEGGADFAGPTHPSPQARVLNHLLTLDEEMKKAGLPGLDAHAQLTGLLNEDFRIIAETIGMPVYPPLSLDVDDPTPAMAECLAVRARLAELQRRLRPAQARAMEMVGGLSLKDTVRWHRSD